MPPQKCICIGWCSSSSINFIFIIVRAVFFLLLFLLLPERKFRWKKEPFKWRGNQLTRVTRKLRSFHLCFYCKQYCFLIINYTYYNVQLMIVIKNATKIISVVFFKTWLWINQLIEPPTFYFVDFEFILYFLSCYHIIHNVLILRENKFTFLVFPSHKVLIVYVLPKVHTLYTDTHSHQIYYISRKSGHDKYYMVALCTIAR